MAWTAPVDFIANTQLNAEQLNVMQDNLRALKAPPTDQIIRDNAGNYTTNSTVWTIVDNTNLAISLTTGGGDVLVWFNGLISAGVSQFTYFDVLVDDVDLLGYSKGFKALVAARNDGSLQRQVSMLALAEALGGGTHTFKLVWYVSAGTASLFSNTGAGTTDLPVLFGAREIS